MSAAFAEVVLPDSLHMSDLPAEWSAALKRALVQQGDFNKSVAEQLDLVAQSITQLNKQVASLSGQGSVNNQQIATLHTNLTQLDRIVRSLSK